MIRSRTIFLCLAFLHGAFSFHPSISISPVYRTLLQPTAPIQTSFSLYALQTDEETTTASKSSPTAEETTEKYGLEAGLFQSLRSQDGESAKSLLAKYGIAYLATSIPLAILSFALCYALVDRGVDVGALLARVGIDAGDAGEKAGTFAIAYAAHKAASPIRFPPTVLLTPVVAKLIGKEVDEGVEKD
ncbi:hypothetical protein ACHAW6_011719 [Cyclotella cf. meneghiniana]